MGLSHICEVVHLSYNLSKSRYSTYDVEFYAIVQAIRHWHHYLFQKEFILYTDHDALKHLGTQDKVSARHALGLLTCSSLLL